MRMLQLWVCNVVFRLEKLLSFPFDCLNDGGILFQSYCFNCKGAVCLIFSNCSYFVCRKGTEATSASPGATA